MIARILTKLFWWLLKRDLVPDSVLRWRVRRGLHGLVSGMDREATDYELRAKIESDFVSEIRESEIAVCQAEANEQHYEVPADFFKIVLGPKLKYSCALFRDQSTMLSQAEETMLDLYIERAQISDGMDILDLGCGWGSVCLHIAERFPACRVVGLSNSVQQREYIEEQARQRSLSNLHILTGDVSVVDPSDFSLAFDRVVSIEMFEHMKNYRALLNKISTWLKPSGKLFVHIFTHKWKPYHFKDDWMGRTFFTGGTMPSHSLLLHFQEDLTIEHTWAVSGSHYARTNDIWLERMDRNKEVVIPILQGTYGNNWNRWWLNWRLFFVVVSETFGLRSGSEWGVSHYLFCKK